MKISIITKTIRYVNKHGFLATIGASLGLIYSRFIYPQFHSFINIFTVNYLIHKRRMKLSSELAVQMNNTVGYGQFKGLMLGKRDDWNGNMFLGLYEKEILEILQELPRNYKILINIGAADGYYAIGGLVAKFFDKTYCYELSKRSRVNIAQNATLNGVQDKIEIFGIATRSFASDLKRNGLDLAKSVVVCDIEGNEFELFDDNVLKLLKNAIIIIEIHDWHKNGAARFKRLKKRAGKYFKVSEFKTGARDLSIFPEIRDLRENDQWLICSDGRHYLQTYLKLEPKRTGHLKSIDNK